MEKRIQTRKEEGMQARPKRTPLGSRNVLAVPERPGYHRVWVSDSSSIRPQIDDYEAAGYTFVQDELKVGDQYVNSANKLASVVSRPGGKGVTLYLMEILDEYYREDMRRQEEDIREREAAMFDPRSIQGGYGSAANRAKTGKGGEDFPTDL